MSERNGSFSAFTQKDGTRAVIASLLSILIGLLAGALVILFVGASDPALGLSSVWDGVRLVLLGVFSTGRDAAGALTFGFNPTSIGNMLFRATPLIMTGLSVALAYKTGLFNIGAPGQYLAGTAATLRSDTSTAVMTSPSSGVNVSRPMTVPTSMGAIRSRVYSMERWFLKSSNSSFRLPT